MRNKLLAARMRYLTSAIKNLRNMIALEREMNKTCKEAYFENKQNLKNLKKEEREELARLKAIPKKRGRPPIKGR